MGYLLLGHYYNLRQLPEQLGGMKWLKELDASHAAIEELPDSITQLKKLVPMNLDGCKMLRKLPQQIGNMKGLRTFLASCSAIEQLPDSFVGLVNLERLELSCCRNLRNLPNSIWKLQLLQVLKKCLRLYEAEVPKMVDWLSYESSGHTISFDIPPLLGDNLLGLALSMDLSCKELVSHLCIRAAVTHKTNGTTKYCVIPLHCNGPQVYSLVQCISGDEISIRSGDAYRVDAPEVIYYVQLKLKMYVVHVIPKTLSTPDFCSVLSNLIN
ncbi:hypothetical protein ACET3Z_029181 [Daucus carota]